MNPRFLPDLRDRADIERLVNAFYEQIRRDELLGFIFEDIAHTDWEVHLPKMYAFWETVLFRSGGYAGDVLGAHARLAPLTAMGRQQFDRWLDLFRSTVDRNFCGGNADHIKNCAADMANVLHTRINKIADPRFDPSTLTQDQKDRYAAYRRGTAADEHSGAAAPVSRS